MAPPGNSLVVKAAASSAFLPPVVRCKRRVIVPKRIALYDNLVRGDDDCDDDRNFDEDEDDKDDEIFYGTMDPSSFFVFAGVDLNPDTLFIESLNDDDGLLYSAEGSIAGNGEEEATLPVRIYWTTVATLEEDCKDEILPKKVTGTPTLDQVRKAFEGSIAGCWVSDYAENENRILLPEDLRAALVDFDRRKPVRAEIATARKDHSSELVIEDCSGDARINQNKIDESTLRFRTFLKWDGSILRVFSANRKPITATKITAPANEIVWWGTLPSEPTTTASDFGAVNANFSSNRAYSDDCDEDPYGVLSEAWNDEQFRELISFSAGEKGTLFLRGPVVRFNVFAMATLEHASGIGWAFSEPQDRDPLEEKNPRGTIAGNQIPLFVLRCASLIMTSSSLACWLLRKGLWETVCCRIRDGVRHGATAVLRTSFLRVLSIWMVGILAIQAFVKPTLKRACPLKRTTPLVEHLTTLSLAMLSLASLLSSAFDYLVLALVRFPIAGLLDLCSSVTTRFQKWRGQPGWASFSYGLSKRMQMSMRGVNQNDAKCSVSMIDTAVFAPVREELIYRFVFDKLWRFAGGTSVSPAWMWTNTLVFGLSHAGNWLPVAPGNDENSSVWDALSGVFFQCTSSFLFTFILFGPLYLRYGLSASIGAHVMVNAVSAGLPLLLRKAAASG